MSTASSQTIRLHTLLAGWCLPLTINDCALSAISMDSRTVSAGGLFISLAKDAQQRMQYLHAAIDAGVSAILYDSEQLLSDKERAILDQQQIVSVAVINLAQLTGVIADRFYHSPSAEMAVIAVTGTNGKTSVSQFIAQALAATEQPCAVIGTLGYGRIDNLQYTGMTTPDPVSLQAMLADFRDQGITHVVVEASSHALEQGRLNGTDIDIAILTNLSRDHLDYHRSIADYAAAKARLFEFASLQTVIINANDQFGQQLLQQLHGFSGQLISYSSDISCSAALRAENTQVTQAGICFDLIYQQQKVNILLPLLGTFNVDNILATLATLMAIDIEFNDALAAVSQCCAVSGRMQAYSTPSQPLVVIDFAHTPDALEQALKTLRIHLSSNGQLWCVFGCGGDRDRGKRSIMGRLAESYADHVVVTDDNPRAEDHRVITADILTGCVHPSKTYVEHNRKLAITYAITNAAAADIVLIAGKGHENYQQISGVKYPFSDAAVVTRLLATASDAHPPLNRGEL